MPTITQLKKRDKLEAEIDVYRHSIGISELRVIEFKNMFEMAKKKYQVWKTKNNIEGLKY